ncbi:hypothetical protein LTR37_006283 [Vermiconidia calcicola]|uniref:Uncharacterized protein n=1 Tax=Vermiconidia calcicola TaxID=1690605 RepID=A0ACC3NJK6_9PEZI|nr:hypothetical protein LTR37_006283 [Vermiconidia calcicola]
MAFKNILLFGAGGDSIGHYILQALVADGSFSVTALVRQSSKSAFPSSVAVTRVADDFPHDELVKALRGQDVVISTIAMFGQAEHYKLIDAAVEAGVERFIPSEWGMDNSDPKNQELCPIFKGKSEVETYLRSKESERFSWTAVATGIWLEWVLNVGFLDIFPIKHEVKYWQDGSHRPSLTTRAYGAQATLQLLKHPDVAKNQRVFLCPVEGSQREVVAELEKQQRVKYSVSHVDTESIVRGAQTKWESDRDVIAAYKLVAAGVLLPEYKADFASAGKQPILEQIVEMPKLTVEDIVREWVEAHPETVR